MVSEFITHLTFMKLFIVGLGAWRVCSLVANENGPWYIFKKFRDWCLHLCATKKWCKELHLDELVTCEWCNSMWLGGVALVFWFFLGDIVLLPMLWCCISAFVIFIKFIIQNLECLLKLLEKLSS